MVNGKEISLPTFFNVKEEDIDIQPLLPTPLANTPKEDVEEDNNQTDMNI